MFFFFLKPTETISDQIKSEDLNGITLNITPPSPKLDKSDSDPECVCGRERSATNNSDNSYDNHSLEADESRNLIGSGNQNQTVITATIHSNPEEMGQNPEQKSYAEAVGSSGEGSAVIKDKVEDKEESDTESIKDMKISSNSRPRLQRMESTTEHALKYMDRVSDDDIVPAPVKSDNPEDVYSKSAKEVRDSIQRKSVKAKGETSHVHFTGVDRDSMLDRIENVEEDNNVEIKSYQKLDGENRSSFRADNRTASDSGISSRRVKSLNVKPHRIESHQDNSDSTQGQKRESWAVRKLRRTLSHGQERNNNMNVNTGEHLEDRGPHSPTSTALNRWKMVLNVQKFQSAMKQQQQEPVPLPNEKKPVTPKISKLVSH